MLHSSNPLLRFNIWHWFISKEKPVKGECSGPHSVLCVVLGFSVWIHLPCKKTFPLPPSWATSANPPGTENQWCPRSKKFWFQREQVQRQCRYWVVFSLLLLWLIVIYKETRGGLVPQITPTHACNLDNHLLSVMPAVCGYCSFITASWRQVEDYEILSNSIKAILCKL